MLLFGGWAGGGIYSGSIWAYDPAANAWTDLGPQGVGPAPRAAHAFAYDPIGGKAILFGGFDGVSYYNDTWAYDPADQHLDQPPARGQRAGQDEAATPWSTIRTRGR